MTNIIADVFSKQQTIIISEIIKWNGEL